MMGAEFCEHANEVPHSCPCPPDCYCKSHTCKTAVGSWSEVTEIFHKLWGHCKESPEYDKQLWIRLQTLLFQIQNRQPPPAEPLLTPGNLELVRGRATSTGFALEIRVVPSTPAVKRAKKRRKSR